MDSLIVPEDNPVSGITQPSNGTDVKLKYGWMGRPRKPAKETDSDQLAMRRNVEKRLSEMFPKAGGPTQQYVLLRKLCGVGEETIRQMMTGGRSPTLKNVALIAAAIGMTLSELFTSPDAQKEKDERDSDDGDAVPLHRR